jgi:hypothetical protein
MQALVDYNKELSKMPVFSMHWLLDKILKDIDYYKFDKKFFKLEIIKYHQLVKESESKKRSKVENYLSSTKIKFDISEIEENQSYSKYECDICTNYGYYSIMQCTSCIIKCCLDHNRPCKCTNNVVNILYRKF